jgi:hypothetical protein
MKDVLTFIFGQISGDVEGQDLYHERDEDAYEVDGDMKLTDFNNLANFGIEDPRMTTIGGVAFRHLDRLPVVGDSISIEDISITVMEMDGHRVARVRVSRGARDDEVLVAGMPADSVEAETVAGEHHDGKMPEPDGAENVTDARQLLGDDSGLEPDGTGNDNNPDRNVVH